MMTVKRVSALPDFEFIGEDLRGKDDEINYVFKASRAAWAVYLDKTPLCVFGLWRLSLVGSATRLWFIPCKDFPEHGRKAVRKLLRNIRRLVQVVGPLSITVDTSNARNVRFAEFLGFEKSSGFIYDNCKPYSYFFLR